MVVKCDTTAIDGLDNNSSSKVNNKKKNGNIISKTNSDGRKHAGGINMNMNKNKTMSSSKKKKKSSTVVVQFTDEKRQELRDYRYTLTSDTLFLLGSIFYFWLSIIEVRYYYILRNVPYYVWNVDDDYTWNDWWNDDELRYYLYQGKDGELYYSRHMVVYFMAAFCFAIAGINDIIRKPGFISFTMTLAGIFGIVSSILSERDVYMSFVFNCVSVHLFCIEAIYLLHSRNNSDDGESPVVKSFIRLADICWVIGSLMDVIMSYIYMFTSEPYIKQTKVSLIAAIMWLLCAIIYKLAHVYSDSSSSVVVMNDDPGNHRTAGQQHRYAAAPRGGNATNGTHRHGRSYDHRRGGRSSTTTPATGLRPSAATNNSGSLGYDDYDDFERYDPSSTGDHDISEEVEEMNNNSFERPCAI